MNIEKYKILFKDFPPIPEHIQIEMKKYYGRNISELDLKVQYYQDIKDIENNILEVGQEVYYVFGKGLERGIIEEILPYKIGFILSRIKIKGKKRYFNSHSCVLIK